MCTYPLFLGPSVLRQVKTHKMLGATTDRNLSWKAHIVHLEAKGQRWFNVFKHLEGFAWGVHQKPLLAIHAALVRGVSRRVLCASLPPLVFSPISVSIAGPTRTTDQVLNTRAASVRPVHDAWQALSAQGRLYRWFHHRAALHRSLCHSCRLDITPLSSHVIDFGRTIRQAFLFSYCRYCGLCAAVQRQRSTALVKWGFTGRLHQLLWASSKSRLDLNKPGNV